MFEAVTFANNCGDNYNKNIIKTLLAYVLLEEGNPLKALEICAEEMTWFSKDCTRSFNLLVYKRKSHPYYKWCR